MFSNQSFIGLVEKHKNFEEELNSRTEQYESLTKTAEELLESADREDKVKIQSQLTELTTAWENIWTLSQNKTKRLEGALSQAEERGIDATRVPVIVDVDASRSKMTWRKEMSPCLTRSRYRGHGITTEQRRMSIQEMMRLQGIREDQIKNDNSEAEFGK